jgi:hypothetical protein
MLESALRNKVDQYSEIRLRDILGDVKIDIPGVQIITVTNLEGDWNSVHRVLQL